MEVKWEEEAEVWYACYPLGESSWFFLQNITVSFHRLLHPHLFSLWGAGTFPPLPFLWHTLTLKAWISYIWIRHVKKLHRQYILGNSSTPFVVAWSHDFILFRKWVLCRAYGPQLCITTDFQKQYLYCTKKNVNFIPLIPPPLRYILYLWIWCPAQ